MELGDADEMRARLAALETMVMALSLHLLEARPSERLTLINALARAEAGLREAAARARPDERPIAAGAIDMFIAMARNIIANMPGEPSGDRAKH